MASYKTRAIIINRLNLGESDRILTLFSPEYGKSKAICKGSRKTKSKFGGHTELFSLVDLVLSTGKSLDIVNDAELVENYFANNPDMAKIKTAYYFAEIINKLLPDHAKNEEVYNLLIYCLEKLDSTDEKRIQLIFVARLLKSLGIYPELTTCVKCEQKPTSDELFFSKSGGGITHQSCSKYFEDATEVDENTIKLWRFIADTPLENLEKLKTSDENIQITSELANSYIHCVTMIDYRSLRVLS